jgi:hypothetical protein
MDVISNLAFGLCRRVSLRWIALVRLLINADSGRLFSPSLHSIIPLYYLIRKPTLVLDFSMTLLFIHVVTTTYKTGRFPTSVYFWVVMLIGSIMMIVGAEQASRFRLLSYSNVLSC